MTKNQTQQDVGPAPLLDPSGNPSLVAPGGLIESAWGNSVVGRVVHRFPSVAAMNAYAAGEGTLAVVGNVVYIRDNGTWKPSGAGRTISFRAIGGAGQNLPVGTPATATFTTETSDSFNVLSGGNFTCPAGWGGRWHFEYSLIFTAGDTGIHQAWLDGPSSRRYAQTLRTQTAGGGASYLNGVATIVLGPAEIVSVKAYSTDATVTTIGASVDQYFGGYYVGPD